MDKTSSILVWILEQSLLRVSLYDFLVRETIIYAKHETLHLLLLLKIRPSWNILDVGKKNPDLVYLVFNPFACLRPRKFISGIEFTVEVLTCQNLVLFYFLGHLVLI